MNKKKIQFHLLGLTLVTLVGACGQEKSASLETDFDEQHVVANAVIADNQEIPLQNPSIAPTIVDEGPVAALPPAPVHPWLERMALDRTVPPWRAYQNHHDLLPTRTGGDEEFMFSFDLDPDNIPVNMGWDDDQHHGRHKKHH